MEIQQPIIIFSDLDGTLLDHYTYDFTPAKSTIAQINTLNIPIVLTTSKTLVEVTTLQQNLEITSPLIIENGAAVYIPKDTFKEQPIDTVCDGNYWVKSFCPDISHWLTIIEQSPKEFNGLYRGFSSLSIEELVELTSLTPKGAESAKCRQYGEPIHWLGDSESKELFKQYLTDAGANVLHGGRFFHVSGDCDKGKALTWLATQYQTLLYKDLLDGESITTIALGDGENDMAMLQAASVAVQVRSPVHPFPSFPVRKLDIVQTRKFGPEGWAQALQTLLATQFSSESQYNQITNSINSEAKHG